MYYSFTLQSVTRNPLQNQSETARFSHDNEPNDHSYIFIFPRIFGISHCYDKYQSALNRSQRGSGGGKKESLLFAGDHRRFVALISGDR